MDSPSPQKEVVLPLPSKYIFIGKGSISSMARAVYLPLDSFYSIFHSPIVCLSRSKLMPTFITGSPQRAKRSG